ncbi:MAG: NTP transferase domain-containing protein [Firmicutes bacterium]|nr:NTP transferase domain-containing protein [Bacillota bacterium]
MRNAIVLAAGKGTRMKSEKSKCMHSIIDRPMLAYITDALKAVGVQRIVLIVGYQKEAIQEYFSDLEFAIQEPQLGTGHAVMQAAQLKDEDGDTVIINGDGPCIQSETIEKLFEMNKDASCTLLTSVLEDGKHYGRIVRNEEGNVTGIVEAKDCTPEQLKICEINAGMYCFKNRDLFDNLDKLETNNAQKEYYLTDMVKILSSQGKKVNGLVIEDRDEVMGINDCVELNVAYTWMRDRINLNHTKNGVQIVDPNRTVIGKDVVIGHDVIIYPNTEILGNTVIGNHVEILGGTYIKDSTIQEGAVVDFSKVVNSTVEANSTIGPMSYVLNDEKVR